MAACRKNRSRISLAVDRRLSLEETFQLEEHVAACADCRALYERATIVEEVLLELPEAPLATRALEAAVANIRSSIEADHVPAATGEAAPLPGPFLAPQDPAAGPPGFVRSRAAWALLAVAAAIVVIAASVWFNLPRTPRSGPELVQDERPVADSAPRVRVADAANREALTASDEADRLSDVRRDVRTILTTAFAGETAAGSFDAETNAAAERFDHETTRLVRENWPVLRLVEDLVSDPDPAVGTAAVRYLGSRGDRLSLAVLGTALKREALRVEVAKALSGHGDAAVPMVAELLEEPASTGDGLAALEAIGSRRAAEAIAEAFLRGEYTDQQRVRLISSLVFIEGPATRSLLGLLASGELAELESEAVLAHLEELDDADTELVACLREPAGLPIEVLLEVTALRQPTEGLAWVEELVEDYEHGSASLSVLKRWRGPDVIASLLRLDRDGRIPDDLLVDATRALIQRDSLRFTRYAEAQVAGGREAEAERLLELLLFSEHPGSARALFAFAISDLLGRESRLMAALAIGEFGQEAEVEEILAVLEDYDDEDRRVLAALLVSVHVVAGPESVADVLSTCHAHSVKVVLQEIDRCRERGTVAAGITRVARALDGAFSPDPSDSWEYLP